MFPWLRPTNPVQDPNNQPRLLGNEADPMIDGLAAQFNPYAADLNAPVDSGLSAFGQVMAERAQQAAMLEEMDKSLKELVEMDKRAKTAQTNIHKTLSGYQQFLAKNGNAVQGINLAHQIAMSGFQTEAQMQQGAFRGLASARAAIAAKIAGGQL